VSLVATALMGARKGRFDERGRPQDIVGHSVPMAAMGGFILLFGFLAFNGGSIGSVTNEGDIDVVSRSVIVTILGGCTGGLTVLFFNRFVLRKKWSYLLTLNGTLSGKNVHRPAKLDTTYISLEYTYINVHVTRYGG
jgi:Amt family ammonium transporter